MKKKKTNEVKIKKVKDFIKEDKRFKLIIIGLVLILLLYVFISGSINRKRNQACLTLREDIFKLVDTYLESKNLLPTLNGTSVTVDLVNMPNDIYFKEKLVSGLVTYTKYNDEYVKTVDIDNASHCSTKEFSKKAKEYDKDKNMSVSVLFNYQTVESYNSKWTNWMPSEKISTEETDGVLLPLNTKNLPDVPKEAVITEHVRETKTYYSYRDKKWKWYKYNVKYSDLSATKPKGYKEKDNATKTKSEDSPWSLDYPKVYDYRHIKSATGYKWYYEEDGKKVYYNNGEYLVESPGEKYTKDNKQSAKMYSYYDDLYRWYNKEKRGYYSSYTSTKPSGYTYKDKELYTYGSWSTFKDESSITKQNKAYREERTDTYSRYLIKYNIYSYTVLEEAVTLEELEKIIGKPYEEIVKDKNIALDIQFTFYKEG